MHTTPSQHFCHTAHTRAAYLISCVGGATPPPHNHTHFTRTPSLPFLQSHSLHKFTGIVCLISRHGLNFDHAPESSRQESKVTPSRGHAQLPVRDIVYTYTGPTAEARAVYATPNQKQSNLHKCIRPCQENY